METTKTKEPVKISGELTHDPDVCRFHVNRPLAEGWTLTFNSSADGKDSPLIDALFGVKGIAQVMVEDSILTIAKSIPEGWPVIAPDVAQAIRGACGGEAAPISPQVIEELQRQPMDGVKEAIQKLFEENINPALAGHGGYVILHKIEGHDVYVEMGGGCQGCASAKVTMRNGVERAIRRVAPQVRRIIDATDHASGENPYFKQAAT